jgi:hypothetical protein
MPLRNLFTREIEDFRKTCKELNHRWGLQRKKQMEDRDRQSKKSFTQLMKKADSILRCK